MMATLRGALPFFISTRPRRSIFSSSNEVTTFGSFP
jgi:hypothetical protein